jgi:hypothetical protein
MCPTFERAVVQSENILDQALARGSEGIRGAAILTTRGTVTAVHKAKKLVTIQVSNGPQYGLNFALGQMRNAGLENVDQVVLIRAAACSPMPVSDR